MSITPVNRPKKIKEDKLVYFNKLATVEENRNLFDISTVHKMIVSQLRSIRNIF